MVQDVGAKAGVVMSVNGDMVYYNSGRQRLAKGTNGQVLEIASNLPSWQAKNLLSIGTMSGVDFDFDSADSIQTKSISGNTTFTGSNYTAGKSMTLFITTDGTERDLAFPSGWIFQGTMPTAQAASKVGTLTLTCASTSEASVRCAYAVEE